MKVGWGRRLGGFVEMTRLVGMCASCDGWIYGGSEGEGLYVAVGKGGYGRGMRMVFCLVSRGGLVVKITRTNKYPPSLTSHGPREGESKPSGGNAVDKLHKVRGQPSPTTL